MCEHFDKVLPLLNLLPKYDDVRALVKDEPEATYIVRTAIGNLEDVQKNKALIEAAETEESCYLVHCLVDRFWEHVNIGYFSEVPLSTRKIYALANYLKIFYLLFESFAPSQIEKCSSLLDDAMLVGYTQNLYENSELLQKEFALLFDRELGQNSELNLPTIEMKSRQTYQCDIPTFDAPTVIDFQKNCFEPKQPGLLINTITHWPALEKWRDLNYINSIAGNRCAPIEIGKNYTTDEWTQQFVKIRDFLRRQFGTDSTNPTEIEYLAQHELFEQIPALNDDIQVPDYCKLGEQATKVDIKAWLGPKSTISPMHYDPKHNLLCQVFGSKHIILAAPTDSANLYAHETKFLFNTSKIDAENLDLEQFPLAKNVRFYHLTLQTGDCLYIPPKWWHYVRSESASFSVSFWWE